MPKKMQFNLPDQTYFKLMEWLRTCPTPYIYEENTENFIVIKYMLKDSDNGRKK